MNSTLPGRTTQLRAHAGALRGPRVIRQAGRASAMAPPMAPPSGAGTWRTGYCDTRTTSTQQLAVQFTGVLSQLFTFTLSPLVCVSVKSFINVIRLTCSPCLLSICQPARPENSRQFIVTLTCVCVFSSNSCSACLILAPCPPVSPDRSILSSSTAPVS